MLDYVRGEPHEWLDTFAGRLVRGIDIEGADVVAISAGGPREAGSGPELQVGDWNADLVHLPAVDLSTLAIWDIVIFEGLAGTLVCDGLGE